MISLFLHTCTDSFFIELSTNMQIGPGFLQITNSWQLKQSLVMLQYSEHKKNSFYLNKRNSDVVKTTTENNYTLCADFSHCT